MDDMHAAPMSILITEPSGEKRSGPSYPLGSSSGHNTPAPMARTVLFLITSVSQPWTAEIYHRDQSLTDNEVTTPGSSPWRNTSGNPSSAGWNGTPHPFDIDLTDGHGHSNDGTILYFCAEETGITFNPVNPITAADPASVSYLYSPQLLTFRGIANKILKVRVETRSPAPLSYNLRFLDSNNNEINIDPKIKNNG